MCARKDWVKVSTDSSSPHTSYSLKQALWLNIETFSDMAINEAMFCEETAKKFEYPFFDMSNR